MGDNGNAVRFTCLILAFALIAPFTFAGCTSNVAKPTPTPPYGLPPIALPADESPHDFQTEWWYFNAHFSDEEGARYALHDVVFQVQQPRSGRAVYVRQIGFLDHERGNHASAERLRTVDSRLVAAPGDFEIIIGDGSVAGSGGEHYRLNGSVPGVDYDLILTLPDNASLQAPLFHDNDGLVDFGEAGVTYYYSHPLLKLSGTISIAGLPRTVTGLAWMDKQWGDFQPVAVFWDWASIQLEDGAVLMLTNLTDVDGAAIDVYATLRRPGGKVQHLSASEFTFEPLADEWVSEATGTAYRTRWRVEIPNEGLAFTLEPLVVATEFASAFLGVVYWEAAVDVIDDEGDRIGQGFIELNWARNFLPN